MIQLCYVSCFVAERRPPQFEHKVYALYYLCHKHKPIFGLRLYKIPIKFNLAVRCKNGTFAYIDESAIVIDVGTGRDGWAMAHPLFGQNVS